jgi:hypothetical protein
VDDAAQSLKIRLEKIPVWRFLINDQNRYHAGRQDMMRLIAGYIYSSAHKSKRANILIVHG